MLDKGDYNWANCSKTFSPIIPKRNKKVPSAKQIWKNLYKNILDNSLWVIRHGQCDWNGHLWLLVEYRHVSIDLGLATRRIDGCRAEVRHRREHNALPSIETQARRGHWTRDRRRIRSSRHVCCMIQTQWNNENPLLSCDCHIMSWEIKREFSFFIREF